MAPNFYEFYCTQHRCYGICAGDTWSNLLPSKQYINPLVSTNLPTKYPNLRELVFATITWSLKFYLPCNWRTALQLIDFFLDALSLGYVMPIICCWLLFPCLQCQRLQPRNLLVGIPWFPFLHFISPQNQMHTGQCVSHETPYQMRQHCDGTLYSHIC